MIHQLSKCNCPDRGQRHPPGRCWGEITNLHRKCQGQSSTPAMLLGSVPSNILTLIGIFHLDCCARSEYSKIFHLDLCSCSGARLLAVQADESSLQQVWVDHWWRGADSNISSNSCSNLSMEKTSLMMTTTFRWCRAPRLVVEPLPCGRWPGRSSSGDHEEEEVSSIVVIANVEPACSNDSDSKQFWIEIVIT